MNCVNNEWVCACLCLVSPAVELSMAYRIDTHIHINISVIYTLYPVSQTTNHLYYLINIISFPALCLLPSAGKDQPQSSLCSWSDGQHQHNIKCIVFYGKINGKSIS